MRRMFRLHPWLSLVTFAYLALVGWITLSPAPTGDGTDEWVSAVLSLLGRHRATDWVTYAGVEFFANVLMFLPLGMFFVLLLGRRRWWSAIVLGVGLSAAIELAQLLFFSTRVADVRDVVSNGSGTVIGVLIALLLTARTAQARRRARSRTRSGTASTAGHRIPALR